MSTGTARPNRAARLGSLAGAAALVLALTACGAGEARCEQLLNETVEAVDGVESVEAGCRENFGSSTAGAGSVHLDADTKEEAYEIIARIEESLARNPEIDSDWYGPTNVTLNDGTHFGASTAEVRVVREELGIEP